MGVIHWRLLRSCAFALAISSKILIGESSTNPSRRTMCIVSRMGCRGTSNKQYSLRKLSFPSSANHSFLGFCATRLRSSFGPNRLQRRSCRRGLGPIGSKEHNLERAVQGESLSILSCRETTSKKYWKFAPTLSWAWPSISTGFTPSPLKVWAQPLARH